MATRRVRVTSSDRAKSPAGWQPSLGAWVEDDGVRFRVWAPDATTVEVALEWPD